MNFKDLKLGMVLSCSLIERDEAYYFIIYHLDSSTVKFYWLTYNKSSNHIKSFRPFEESRNFWNDQSAIFSSTKKLNSETTSLFLSLLKNRKRSSIEMIFSTV